MRLAPKRIDLVVIIALYLLFILPPVVFTTSPPLALNAFWFIIPAFYLIARQKKNLHKIALATLFIGLLTLSMDFFLLHNHAWEPYRSNFSFHIFKASIEEVVWFFSHIFYILVWYEHFLDDERVFRVSPRILLLIIGSITFFCFILLAVYLFPDASRIRYAYSIFGALTMIPVFTYFLLMRRPLFKKFLPLAVFFFLFALGMEVRAIQFGLWSFQDTQNYFGLVTLFNATFPIEELIFWMTLGPSVALAYYEFFADDSR